MKVMNNFLWGWMAGSLFNDNEGGGNGGGIGCGTIIIFLIFLSIIKFIGEVFGITGEEAAGFIANVWGLIKFILDIFLFLPFWDVSLGISDDWHHFTKAALSIVNIVVISVVALYLFGFIEDRKIKLLNSLKPIIFVFWVAAIVFSIFRIPMYILAYLFS